MEVFKMKRYELTPNGTQKSFYGKAVGFRSDARI